MFRDLLKVLPRRAFLILASGFCSVKLTGVFSSLNSLQLLSPFCYSLNTSSKVSSYVSLTPFPCPTWNILLLQKAQLFLPSFGDLVMVTSSQTSTTTLWHHFHPPDCCHSSATCPGLSSFTTLNTLTMSSIYFGFHFCSIKLRLDEKVNVSHLPLCTSIQRGIRIGQKFNKYILFKYLSKQSG